jgi:hypothetical protein
MIGGAMGIETIGQVLHFCPLVPAELLPQRTIGFFWNVTGLLPQLALFHQFT